MKHYRAVDVAEESLCRRLVCGDDTLGVPRPVMRDMPDRLVDSIDDSNRHDRVEVFGSVLGEPLHQTTADVQRDRQLRIAAEQVQKGRVALVVSCLEHAVEVAHGLVVVKGENEPNAV